MTMTTSVAEGTVSQNLTHKSLVSDQLWHRLVQRIVTDETENGREMDVALAERIMNEALGFLRICAADPEGSHSPSPLVDIGWHTFILYTREYAAFCTKVAGRFIHHSPNDVPGVEYGRGGANRTAESLQAHGFVVDLELWSAEGQGCSRENDDDCQIVGCGTTEGGGGGEDARVAIDGGYDPAAMPVTTVRPGSCGQSCATVYCTDGESASTAPGSDRVVSSTA